MKLEKNQKIQEWIKAEIVPYLIKTINFRKTSYKLKHIAESELGFYISNEELIENMELLGIKGVDIKATPINKCYPISQKFFNLKMGV